MRNNPETENQAQIQSERDEFSDELKEKELGDMDSVHSYALEEHKTRAEAEEADKEILGNVPAENIELVRRALREKLEKTLKTGSRFHETTLEMLSKDAEILSKEMDSLTGVWRRNMGEKVLEKMTREKKSFAIAFLDIDHFKAINDIYGHSAGDQVLKKFANRIKEKIKEGDTMIRWGGEEFILVLENISEEDALKRVDQLRALIEGEEFEVKTESKENPGTYVTRKIPVNMSSGVRHREGDEDEVTADMLIEQADRALYAAKEGGRNKVYFISKDKQPEEYRPKEEEIKKVA